MPASTVVHTDDIWSQAMFDWAELLIGGVLEPVHRDEPVSFRPPAWQKRNRDGAIEVPPGRELVIVEGAGAARHELMPMLDAVIWVQSDMAEELPFMARQQPWTRANIIAAGAPRIPHDPATEVVIAQPGPSLGMPP